MMDAALPGNPGGPDPVRDFEEGPQWKRSNLPNAEVALKGGVMSLGDTLVDLDSR